MRRPGPRLVLGAGLAAALASVLAGCTQPGGDDAVRDVVEEYLALLEDGKAEAADALDTYDPSATRCPELFTDEVYGTVPDRPTDLRITGVTVNTNDARVEATIDLGDRDDVEVTFRLVPKGDTWLIDNPNDESGFETDGVVVVGSFDPGEVTVQGRCALALRDAADVGLAYTGVYPGAWTVEYTDPAGVAAAEPATVVVLGTLRQMQPSGEPRDNRVELAPEVSAEALAAVDDAVRALVEACVAEGLTGPSCAPGVASRITAPPTGIELGEGPATIEDSGEGWRFVASIPVTWQDGTEFKDTTLTYHGGVVIDDDGTAHLDLDE